MSDGKPPKRRYEFSTKIGADSIKDLKHALKELDLWLSRDYQDETSTNGASGGWSSGWLYELTFNAGMDGDKYRAELEEWMKRQEEKPAEGDTTS